jgi:hypothetical protein
MRRFVVGFIAAILLLSGTAVTLHGVSSPHSIPSLTLGIIWGD